MTLSELIAKLEAATEGSRDLDALINLTLQTPAVLRPFTEDLESARSLIPRPLGSMSLASGFEVGGFADDRPWGAWAKVYYDPSMVGGPSAPPYEAKGASPALALCAAALKARL